MCCWGVRQEEASISLGEASGATPGSCWGGDGKGGDDGNRSVETHVCALHWQEAGNVSREEARGHKEREPRGPAAPTTYASLDYLIATSFLQVQALGDSVPTDRGVLGAFSQCARFLIFSSHVSSCLSFSYSDFGPACALADCMLVGHYLKSNHSNNSCLFSS